MRSSTSVSASSSAIPLASRTAFTVALMATLKSFAPSAVDVSTDSISRPASFFRRRSRSRLSSVTCAFSTSASRAFPVASPGSIPASSKNRPSATRWYQMNSTSHASPPAMGAQRFPPAEVAKHADWARSVRRLRAPSNRTFASRVNPNAPRGSSPSS